MDLTQVTSPRIAQHLTQAILNNRLGHALLFLGENSPHKEKVAICLSAGLLCENRKTTSSIPFGCKTCASCKRVYAGQDTHINLIMSLGEKNRRGLESQDAGTSVSDEIRIDQVRQLNHEQRMRGYDEGAQVWLIIDGHRLTAQAANALLKTLEEPQNDRFVIILAPSLKSVLPTIASRCQRLIFPADDSTDELSVGESEAQQNAQALFERIQHAPLSLRLKIAEELSKNKDELEDILKALQLHIMRLIRESTHDDRVQLRELAGELEKTQGLLKRHVNATLLLEELLLKIWPLNEATRAG